MYRQTIRTPQEIADENLEREAARHLQAEILALRAQLDEARAVIRPLIQLCPCSNDMRLLHVVAFSKTTAAYDGLDEAIRAAAAWLAGSISSASTDYR